MSVFVKLLFQWKACDPFSAMLPGFRKEDPHSTAVVAWDGSQAWAVLGFCRFEVS